VFIFKTKHFEFKMPPKKPSQLSQSSNQPLPQIHTPSAQKDGTFLALLS